MENKYYTPELDEFCEGFEYQTNNVSLKPLKDQVWHDRVFSLNIGGAIKYDLSDACSEREYRNKSIRVKYLDREDIESLGFEFDEEDETCVYFRNSLDYELCFEKEGLSIQIDLDFACGDDETVFQGTIKNKSEFKKLLKQLGI